MLYHIELQPPAYFAGPAFFCQGEASFCLWGLERGFTAWWGYDLKAMEFPASRQSEPLDIGKRNVSSERGLRLQVRSAYLPTRAVRGRDLQR